MKNILFNISNLKKTIFYLSLFIISWWFAIFSRDIDFDFWARISVGKIFLKTGNVLKNDIFSFTTTKNIWIDHEWGAGVIFYYLVNHFGGIAIIALKITCIFLILFLISKIIELKNTKINSHLNILLYILPSFAMLNGLSSTIRAQTLTFLLFTLWIYILERIRLGENRLLWTLPVLMVIWANIHGGFVAGIGVLLICALGEFLNKKPYKKYLIISILVIFAVLINPYGVKYFYFILNAISMPRPHIAEWWPTNLFGPLLEWFAFKFLLLLSLISIIFSLIKDKLKYTNLDKVKYLLIFTTVYLSIAHIKHQPFFVIIAGSFLYHDIQNIFIYIGNKIKGFKYIATGKDILIYSFLIYVGFLVINKNFLNIRIPQYKYPVGSVEFIKQNKLSGNLLSTFNWGSYIAWNLYPNCLIAIDGRYEEVYSKEIDDLTANFNYVINKDWYRFIEKYHTDILLLDKRLNSYLLISRDKNWKKIHEDGISTVFIPNSK